MAKLELYLRQDHAERSLAAHGAQLLAAVTAAAQAARGTHNLFLEYPIWMWHWTSAEGDEVLLSEQMLSHFQRPFETFLDVAGQFTPAGPDGDIWLQRQFDAMHVNGAEPWNQPSWYEQRKRGLLLAGLPRARFRSELELGCSTGALTEDLAHRCEKVFGIDASMEAVNTARLHTAGLPAVSCRHGVLPQDWPAGHFDLFVLSESGYHLTEEGLAGLLEQMAASALPNAHMAACRWRHRISGGALGGKAFHRTLRTDNRPVLGASYAEDDFLLDIFHVKESS